MTDEEYERWLAGFVLVGDEAFLPGERPEKRPYRRLTEEQRRHYSRDKSRRYRARATYRAREQERQRRARGRRRHMREGEAMRGSAASHQSKQKENGRRAPARAAGFTENG